MIEGRCCARRQKAIDAVLSKSDLVLRRMLDTIGLAWLTVRVHSIILWSGVETRIAVHAKRLFSQVFCTSFGVPIWQIKRGSFGWPSVLRGISTPVWSASHRGKWSAGDLLLATGMHHAHDSSFYPYVQTPHRRSATGVVVFTGRDLWRGWCHIFAAAALHQQSKQPRLVARRL